MLKIFDKANLKTVLAESMDANRYFADAHKIDYFYDLLYSFTQTNDIPAQFVMNLDEEGHESYADSIKQVIVVSKELEGPF